MEKSAMFRFSNLRVALLPLVTSAALAGAVLPAQAGTVVIQSGGVVTDRSYYPNTRYPSTSNYYYPNTRVYRSTPDYYYPDTRYRSTPGYVIRRNIEDSTLVRPVIIDSQIEDSTIVNPVIVTPRQTGTTIIRERPAVTNPACMAFSSMRIACQ
jgi:hypothetical protein